MRRKAVLDTNVLISGVFWKGPPFEILTAWQDGRFTLVVSPEILKEYARVLAELKADRPLSIAETILELIERHSQTVRPNAFPTPVCDDPDDDKFLEAALAARAQYVVTGDSALLRMRNYRQIQIIKPARFLQVI